METIHVAGNAGIESVRRLREALAASARRKTALLCRVPRKANIVSAPRPHEACFAQTMQGVTTDAGKAPRGASMNNSQNRSAYRVFQKGPLASCRQAGLYRSRRPACQSAQPLSRSILQAASEDLYSDASPNQLDLAFYRRRTELLLRRYLRMSLEVGRVPSCLPKEALRARRTIRQPFGTFEDCVIFVHDIERCLEGLDRLQAEVLTRIALQEYTQREASEIIGLPQRSVGRYYDDALDRLSAVLLQRKLLQGDG
jgi:hypothetical protein